MSIILYETREIERFIKNKEKKAYDRSKLVDEVGNKTIGIFGTGLIGQEVAKKAQSFNMNVLGYNTDGRSVQNFNQTYTLDQKEELIKACDFIVLLLPLTKETHHFFSKKEFKLMKKEAYIINIGRGPLIKEDDLIHALESNRIKGAALDVFDEEPLPENNPLWDVDRLILTPHLSGKSKFFFERSINIFKESYVLYKDKKQLKFQIDYKKEY